MIRGLNAGLREAEEVLLKSFNSSFSSPQSHLSLTDHLRSITEEKCLQK